MIKLCSLLLAVGSLGGCVAYPAHYGPSGSTYPYDYDSAAYYGGAPVLLEQPVYMYGYGGYRYRYQPRPDGRWHKPHRDRDHDGIPNRLDRDRDGDGTANRRDRYPNNPRRP